MRNFRLDRFILPERVQKIIQQTKNVLVPESRAQLVEMASGGQQSGFFQVVYNVPKKGEVVEATVAVCKNGISVNFTEPYMRRRDPDAILVGDKKPTDKETYQERYGKDFETVRNLTFDWLEQQDLIVMPFMAGGREYGYPALFIGPMNAAFFAASLADLQAIIPRAEIPDEFCPKAVLFLAPPFRQMVNRL